MRCSRPGPRRNTAAWADHPAAVGLHVPAGAEGGADPLGPGEPLARGGGAAVRGGLRALGKFAQISDVVAYATIIWVRAMLLISFGWAQGKRFWVPVLHLVYMLPLPGVLYFKLSTFLQGVSSELGVWFLTLMHVPVFLDGNIIDLGVLKMHVAEACSGLRYLFPIMSFSLCLRTVLYPRPWWHRRVLLLAAAPITVLMNSVRIAVAELARAISGRGASGGVPALLRGLGDLLASVVILFGLAWVMLKLQDSPMSLTEALDLDFTGLWPQFKRLGLAEASKGMIGGGADSRGSRRAGSCGRFQRRWRSSAAPSRCSRASWANGARGRWSGWIPGSPRH